MVQRDGPGNPAAGAEPLTIEDLRGVYTGWTPLDSVVGLFATDLDRKDPWQFQNILVR